jgi:hypothetical protein
LRHAAKVGDVLRIVALGAINDLLRVRVSKLLASEGIL